MSTRRSLAPIGWREWIGLPDLCPTAIKAKVDTGARTSSLHAFDLSLHGTGDDAVVEFEIHPHQRSAHDAIAVRVPVIGIRKVRPSTGHAELRPVIRTTLRVGEHRFPIDVTLTSRDAMGFRLLIGRSALRRHFLVDSGRSFLQGDPA